MSHSFCAIVLRAGCFCALLIAGSASLRAQSAQPNLAPRFAMSANGSAPAQIYQGWALIFQAMLYHPDVYSTTVNVIPLRINPQNGSWANNTRLLVSDSNGVSQNWPIHLATIPSGSINLDATNVGTLTWVLGPSDTAGITPGTYRVLGILDSANSAGANGWSGSTTSNPVYIQLSASPASVTPAQQERQFELLARYDHLLGNDVQAVVDINTLLTQQPNSIGALALQGNLLDQLGQTSNALAAYDQAVATFFAANPQRLPEPPDTLLIPQGRLRAKLLSQSGTRGQPQVSINVQGQGTQSPGVFFVDLQITNIGNDVAENVLINQLTFQTLSGTGQAFLNNVLSPPLPIFSDFLGVNGTTTVRVFVTAQGTVNSFSLTETGTAADIFGAPNSFSQTQTISLNFTGNLGPLTVMANNATQPYGKPIPPLNNVTCIGFVNGDTPSSLSGTPSCTTTATQSSPVGTYPISCSGLSSTSYIITFVPGTLTITPASLSIATSSAVRQYGQANPSLNNVTYSGFVNGDTVSSLSGSLLCTTPATPMSSVGSYAITCSGLTSPNYSITFVPGTLTITPAPLAIAANNNSRPYGANNPTLTGQVTGLQNADPVSAGFTTNAVPASPVGTYPITPVVLDPSNRLGNYALSLVNGVLSVVPESTSLSLTLSPASIPIGQSAMATITLTAPDMVIPIDPSVLTPLRLTSPVVSDILSNNGACTPVPGTTPGLATCTISVTSIEPNGRTLIANFPGGANLAASASIGELIVTAALQSQQVCIASDFRNVTVPGGSTLWLSSIFKGRDISKQLVHISFFGATVQFQYTDAAGNLVTVNQALPDAHITIDPNVTISSTTFDAVNNVWNTTLVWDLDDNSFLTGMPWVVPSPGLPADVEPVTVCGTFASDVANIDIGWRWAAAAYSSFGGNNTLGVKPMDTDHDNSAPNHDHAGTPENYKQFVIPGARGKGGKNYTGSYSRSTIIE